MTDRRQHDITAALVAYALALGKPVAAQSNPAPTPDLRRVQQ